MPDWASSNYLICMRNKGKVREVDPKGKTVWEFTECSHPLDADRLPNGNTLIAGGKSKRVLEVDPKGEIVWEWKGTNRYDGQGYRRSACCPTAVDRHRSASL